MNYSLHVHSVRALLLALLCAFLNAAPTSHSPTTTPHSATTKWTYGKCFPGPRHWHKLQPDYELCKIGHRQSPVDIPVDADFATEVINNQGPGQLQNLETMNNNTLMVDDKTCKFMKFHFHSPSEHKLNGKQTALEMQMVHMSDDGDYAVVAVFFDHTHYPNEASTAMRGPRGYGKSRENTTAPHDIADELSQGNLASLAKHKWIQFQGSFTTPPCMEGVTWLISPTVHPIPEKAVKFFRFALMQGMKANFKGTVRNGNARNIQPRNKRLFDHVVLISTVQGSVFKAVTN